MIRRLLLASQLGGGRIKNIGRITAVSFMVDVKWTYPVASRITIATNYGDIITLSGDTDSVEGVLLGPGMTFDNMEIISIDPSQDDTYIYEVVM